MAAARDAFDDATIIVDGRPVAFGIVSLAYLRRSAAIGSRAMRRAMGVCVYTWSPRGIPLEVRAPERIEAWEQDRGER